MKAAPCLTRCRRQALPAHAAHFMRPKALPETVSMGRRLMSAEIYSASIRERF